MGEPGESKERSNVSFPKALFSVCAVLAIGAMIAATAAEAQRGKSAVRGATIGAGVGVLLGGGTGARRGAVAGAIAGAVRN